MANVYKLLKCLLVFAMLIYIGICPYTKVEESFNIQSMHDILYHGYKIEQYDHVQFPGVVPRTFIAPIAFSTLWYPVALIFGQIGIEKIIMQYLVRLGLGLVVCLALFRFCRSIEKKVSRKAAVILCGITLTEFHFLFYASRPLPNVFALIMMLLAYSCWIESRMIQFIWLSGFSIIVFRFELCMLAGIMLFISIVKGDITIARLIFIAVPAGLLSLGLTVIVDSYFWQKWLWPEGMVFYYNAILNKSSNWGTMPFFWYFYSVLPRALLSSIFFVPLGLLSKNRTVLYLFIPALAFVFLFSFLPHKELRFIIYTFPIFNTMAAVGIEETSNWLQRHRPKLRTLFHAFVAFSLMGNLILSAGFAYASHLNYPGGVALARLHSLENKDNAAIHVHIDNLAAQTGVTRFGEISSKWRYSKIENLTAEAKERLGYSHLLTAAPCDEYLGSYRLVDRIYGFGSLQIAMKEGVPIKFQKQQRLCILKRR